MMARFLNFVSAIVLALIALQETVAFAPTSRCILDSAVHHGTNSPFSSSHIHSPSKSIPATCLKMSVENEASKSNLPMLLDPGTKGGALFLSFLLFLLPVIGYEIVTVGFGFDSAEAGKWIGAGFTAFICVAWVGTYVFRVATKDMTYAKQLKDYENAVIAKRLEELDEDEVQALIEDIERDDF